MNKKSSGSGPENRLTAVGISCADHVTPLYPQKLTLTSPTGGGRSVGIVRSRTKATEFYVSLMYELKKKLERHLRVNLLGPGPCLMKKEFTGPRSHKFEKHWSKLSYNENSVYICSSCSVVRCLTKTST